jgi:peptidyl-Asp metalloendopeptidase
MKTFSRVVLGAITSFLICIPVFAQAESSLFEIARSANASQERISVASVEEADIAFTDLGSLTDGRSSIVLPLLDGKTYRADRTKLDLRGMDNLTWVGNIREGRLRGDVVLSVFKGHVAGLIYTDTAVYEIVPRGGRHILARIEQSRFPECGGDVPAPVTAVPDISNLNTGVDSGDRIDVLVVYTTATKLFLGGDSQARAFAQQAIDVTNAAYANSKIRQRVNLVHAEEILFTETGNSSSDLTALRNNTAVQGLRNTHKADLVAMIAEVADVCGIGYLTGSPTQSESGYTISARSCAVSNVTFAHELGHNMGSNHNPENSGAPPLFPYSFGHYVNGSFRTVMSYSDPCPSGCARRPYFSNPEIFLNGSPTGIDGFRDNARSLNNSADVMANFRYSGSSITLTNFNGGEILPRGVRRSVTWTSDGLAGNVRIDFSRDDGQTWETVVADTPNDGSEFVSIHGRSTRRARVRVTSVAAPKITDSSIRNISFR